MNFDDIDWPEDLTGVLPVPEQSEEMLNPRQQKLYALHRSDWFTWLLEEGKNPRKRIGYSPNSMATYSSRQDKIYRWVWGDFGFTTSITQSHADAYVEEHLRFVDDSVMSENAKRKDIDVLKLIFKWQARDDYGNHDWETPIKFRASTDESEGFTDWFEVEEIRRIREASLSFGSVPSRDGMDDEEQDQWNAHLAQKFGIPKEEVDETHWQRANSYKIPSLVAVSCSVGFRPIEVERSRKSWFDTETGVMRVPKAESSKNKAPWRCYLSDEAINALDLWIAERENDPMYDETDAMWLNREGNPYNAKSLRDLMMNLMEEAGMPTENREVGWYLLRRGVGTHIGSNFGLKAVMDQLRIKRVETAKRYIRSPSNELAEAVNTI